jgi:hypothetical protein
MEGLIPTAKLVQTISQRGRGGGLATPSRPDRENPDGVVLFLVPARGARGLVPMGKDPRDLRALPPPPRKGSWPGKGLGYIPLAT